MKSEGGLTKQRALIVSGLLQTLGDISVSERPDRTGTIRLGPGALIRSGRPAGARASRSAHRAGPAGKEQRQLGEEDEEQEPDHE